MSEKTCRHCGKRIVRSDFLGREAWTHQPAGASFMDHSHRYCRVTEATPACCDRATVTTEIEDHWLVERHQHHTCGTSEGGHYGAHEPGCGTVPLVALDGLPGWDALVSEIESRVRGEVAAAIRERYPEMGHHVLITERRWALYEGMREAARIAEGRES